MGNLPQRVTETEPESLHEEPDRSDKRQTLYLPYHVHEALRNIAHNERKSQQELFREAIDWLLRDRGEPSWDELKRRS